MTVNNLQNIPWGVWQYTFYEAGFLNFVDITSAAQTSKELYKKIFSLNYFIERRSQCFLFEHAFKVLRSCPLYEVTLGISACEKLLDKQNTSIPFPGTELILKKIFLLKEELTILFDLSISLNGLEEMRQHKSFQQRLAKYRETALAAHEIAPHNTLRTVIVMATLLTQDCHAASKIAFNCKLPFNRDSYGHWIKRIVLFEISQKNEEEAWLIFNNYALKDSYKDILPFFKDIKRSITIATELASSLRLKTFIALLKVLKSEEVEYAYTFLDYLETPFERDELRTYIAARLVREMRFDDARNMKRNIENADDLTSDSIICWELNNLYFCDQDFEMEFHMAMLLADRDSFDFRMIDLVQRVAKANLPNALAWSETIHDKSSRREARYLALSHGEHFVEVMDEAIAFGSSLGKNKNRFFLPMTQNILCRNLDEALTFIEKCPDDFNKDPLFNAYLDALIIRDELVKATKLLHYFSRGFSGVYLAKVVTAIDRDELSTLNVVASNEIVRCLPDVPPAQNCINPEGTFLFAIKNFPENYHQSVFKHICKSILNTRSIYETLNLLGKLPEFYLKNIQIFVINAKPFASFEEGLKVYGILGNNLLARVDVLLKLAKIRPLIRDYDTFKKALERPIPQAANP